jgi:TPR repeat protein
MKPLAEQGDAFAQYNLALIYSKGQGVPQDYAEAAKWYRKAAEQGDADAQYNLALFYYNGQGVPQDYAEAAKWYRRAAEQGNTKAQLNLGFMYGTGQGVPQDHVLAHMWYNIAASRFSVLEKEARENAVKNKDIAASRMTPAQIAEAQRLAREWKPKKEGK